MTGLINGTWGEEPNGVDDLMCVRVADFDRTRFVVVDAPPTLRAIGKEERSNRLLRQGDLLIEKSGGGYNQPVGCVVDFNHTFDAVCSNFIGRIAVAPGMWSRYWTYVHATLYSSRLNVPAIKQTTGIQNLDTDAYFNQRVPFPPLPQQRAIADYLDRETVRLDALVAAKERVLGLLAEKRRALITRAVTRGLDPDASLRDSGIPWLGEIPAHWEVKRLKHISPHITVGVVVNPSSYVTPDGVPFLYGSDITEEGINPESARRIPIEVSGGELAKTCLRTGDLVTVRVGAPGITAVVPPELDGANCASIMLTRCAASFDSNWLAYAMNSSVGKHQVSLVQYGAAQEQFNIAHAVDFSFAVPPLTEQRDIVLHIDSAIGAVDALRRAMTQTIELLKERRAALIASAVTGQLELA